MPEAKFEMCTCGRHGILTRPSGVLIKTRKKQEARDHLKAMWQGKLLTAATYMSVRNEIDSSHLPDGGSGMMEPDDPTIEIMNESEAEFEVEAFPRDFDFAAPPEKAPPRNRFN